jgi:cupin 2 domain-containing protein
MMPVSGNIFADVERPLADEAASDLVASPNVRIERIVSHGQAMPAGAWYDQEWDEWVIVLKGSAGLLFEGDNAARVLGPGDHVRIPAHARHRVQWTAPGQPTVWLAVHFRASEN